MLIRVKKVKHLKDYKLLISFTDGSEKIFDMKEIIDKGGVFASLKDPEYFKAVKVNKEFRTIEWPGGVDICPDTLYEEGKEVKAARTKKMMA